MKSELLELEKNFFKYEYMSNYNYLNNTIDDSYIEVGKSGRMFNKKIVVDSLLTFKENRPLTIYNFTYEKLGETIYLVHYITKDNETKIYRTSIWKLLNNDLKIIFHQASLLNDEVNLVES